MTTIKLNYSERKFQDSITWRMKHPLVSLTYLGFMNGRHLYYGALPTYRKGGLPIQ